MTRSSGRTCTRGRHRTTSSTGRPTRPGWPASWPAAPRPAAPGLLDLACGTGQLTFALRPYVAEVWAVDQEPGMTAVVTRKAGPDGGPRGVGGRRGPGHAARLVTVEA